MLFGLIRMFFGYWLELIGGYVYCGIVVFVMFDWDSDGLVMEDGVLRWEDMLKFFVYW